MSGRRPSPNDQRSNVMNPNDPAYKQDRDNRGNQLDPNHAPSKGSAGPRPGGDKPGSGR